LLCDNGCSGLLIAFERFFTGSLPMKAPGWRPGRAVILDYTGAVKDVKEVVEELI
jgi:hypothetical protein